jgi:aryl-alcohol dehydrogenase-like predicted oxidoreductase
MEIRQIGNSGLKGSIVGLGGNNFGGRLDKAATESVVHRALDLGVTFFDTADAYGKRGGGETGLSESYLGAALGARRKDVVIATKFGNAMDPERRLSGASRLYIVRAVEASLRRLNTDWIDLYQLHSPDPLTPIEETLRALDDLVRSGKVLYVGCANLSAWQFVASQWTAHHSRLSQYVSCQSEYSLINRKIELELLPAINIHGASILPYYPLASGLLTGKYRPKQEPPPGSRFANPERFEKRFMTEQVTRTVERLRNYAEERGRTLLELAMSWLASQPHVGSIIAGATSPEQVSANVGAASWRLTSEELNDVNQITRPN